MATSKAHHPDVVNHAVNFIEKKENIFFDFVIMLQPTSPFRNSKHIDNAISKFLNENNTSLISIKKQDYPPWWLFRAKNKLTQFLNLKIKMYLIWKDRNLNSYIDQMEQFIFVKENYYWEEISLIQNPVVFI